MYAYIPINRIMYIFSISFDTGVISNESGRSITKVSMYIYILYIYMSARSITDYTALYYMKCILNNN